MYPFSLRYTFLGCLLGGLSTLSGAGLETLLQNHAVAHHYLLFLHHSLVEHPHLLSGKAWQQLRGGEPSEALSLWRALEGVATPVPLPANFALTPQEESQALNQMSQESLEFAIFFTLKAQGKAGAYLQELHPSLRPFTDDITEFFGLDTLDQGEAALWAFLRKWHFLDALREGRKSACSPVHELSGLIKLKKDFRAYLSEDFSRPSPSLASQMGLLVHAFIAHQGRETESYQAICHLLLNDEASLQTSPIEGKAEGAHPTSGRLVSYFLMGLLLSLGGLELFEEAEDSPESEDLALQADRAQQEHPAAVEVIG